MTSHPEFGEKTSALEVAEAFSDRIKGKNVIVTGVSPKSCGQGTAAAFASQYPANLLLLSRTKSKLEAVAEELREKYPGVNIKTIILDLASQQSIRAAAAEVANTISKLDLLINNAGATPQTRIWTQEGIDFQFGANHVGPFLLTNLLLPLLQAAAKDSPPGETRIVNLSSHAHFIGPIRFSDYNITGKEVPPEEKYRDKLPPEFLKPGPDGYLPVIAYGQSKTANILHALSLQKYLEHQGISSYALHPGGVKTELGRDQDAELSAVIEKTSKYWKTPDQGASTTLVAALDPKLDKISGLYLDNCQFFDSAPWTKDPVAADKLWKLSEELVGQEFKLDVTPVAAA